MGCSISWTKTGVSQAHWISPVVLSSLTDPLKFGSSEASFKASHGSGSFFLAGQ